MTNLTCANSTLSATSLAYTATTHVRPPNNVRPRFLNDLAGQTRHLQEGIYPIQFGKASIHLVTIAKLKLRNASSNFELTKEEGKRKGRGRRREGGQVILVYKEFKSCDQCSQSMFGYAARAHRSFSFTRDSRPRRYSPHKH